MAVLSLGVIVTLCTIGVSLIFLIFLYCVCRSKNKLYDHTCVALLHPDEEKQMYPYKPSQNNTKKESVVHVSGHYKENAPRDTKLGGQNSVKEKRNSKELANERRGSKRGSKKLAKNEEKRSSKRETRNNNTKDQNRISLRENKSPSKNSEMKNEGKAELKRKRSSKKELKPYEVKVELRQEEPLESSPVNLFRQTSDQHPDKCPLSIDNDKATTREYTRTTSQDTRPSKDTDNPHYLRPKSFEENTLTAKERREKYSRSHSDSVFKHSINESDRKANLYMRPRSLDAQDGRLVNEDHYVKPRSSGRGEWDEKRIRESQRSSSAYYVTPRTLEKDEIDSYYVRPRSFEGNEREKTRGSEQYSSYYTSPRAQDRDSHYVRPKSFEENEKRKENGTYSSYVSPKSIDTREGNIRDGYYVAPRTLEKEEKARLDRESYNTRPRSLDDKRDDKGRNSFDYVAPRSSDRGNTQERDSYYVHPRTLGKERERTEDHYVAPRSFDNKDDRDSYYVHPRTLEKEERARRDRESQYVVPRSFDKEDNRDSYYVHPRTLEKEELARREKDSRNDMAHRGEKQYSSTINVRSQPTNYRDRERRPRSADRVERQIRDLKESQRSSSYYMTPRTLEMEERERRDRYKKERDESRDKKGARERSSERERRERSRERRDDQSGTRRDDRSDGRRRSEERYRTNDKYEGKERDTRERSRERTEKAERDRRGVGTEKRRHSEEGRRESSRERERYNERERNERNTERGRKDMQHKKDDKGKLTDKEERNQKERRERSTERDEKDRKFKRDGRERSSERNERERNEWKGGVERRSSRGRERTQRTNDREKDDNRSWSPKRQLHEDRSRPRSRMRSHSLEYLPSSMERKKRQMHVIQRTKSWASRPQVQRSESPPIPPQTIQLEFHPLSGHVTTLDTKSEASTEPHSIEVVNNVNLESSPVLDFERPAKRFYDKERQDWKNVQTDSRRSSATPTSSFVNEGRKDLYHQGYTRQFPIENRKSDSRRSATPNYLQTDSRRSSATNSAVNDYSPRLENNGDQTILSGSLVFEYATDKRAKTHPWSADFPLRPQETQADIYTKSKSTQDIISKPQNIQENSYSKPNSTQGDVFSKLQGSRTETFTKPKATQTDVSSKPQATQTDSFSQPKEEHPDLYAKVHDTHLDVFSTSSYDSQSSTDDYRVYQNEVRKLNGRPRSTGSKITKKESSGNPLDMRIRSERGIDLKTAMPEAQPRRTPTSSISSEDVDWHLYTVDGKRVIRPESTQVRNGLEWHMFTLSNDKQNTVTRDAVTQSTNESRNHRSAATTDEPDDEVFTQAPTVKRRDSRSKGSVRTSLESHFKSSDVKKSHNLVLNTDLQRSSSQPVIFNFE